MTLLKNTVIKLKKKKKNLPEHVKAPWELTFPDGRGFTCGVTAGADSGCVWNSLEVSTLFI